MNYISITELTTGEDNFCITTIIIITQCQWTTLCKTTFITITVDMTDCIWYIIIIVSTVINNENNTYAL